MPHKVPKLSTQLIVAGEPIPRIMGAVAMPTFESAMYETRTKAADYNDIKYIRLSNTPNHTILHAKLAALESAEAALVAASGMAAVTATLLSVLKPGDHLLVQESLYGGTQAFLREDGPALGITFDSIDPWAPDTWRERLKASTKLIYVESISNPILRIPNFQAVTDFARKNKLLSVIDNTFATPVNFRPLPAGFDVVVHSATKYLNGHSDLCAGVVAGPQPLIDRARAKLAHFGGVLAPHSAAQLHRALKTLEVRVTRQNQTALTVAKFLAEQAAVAKVVYPGLRNHPQHEMAAKSFDGFGGMIAFELKGGLDAAERLLEQVRIVLVAPSLGGVESSITRPAATSHLGISAREREAMGISDGLLRLSIGLEDPEDICMDLAAGLG